MVKRIEKNVGLIIFKRMQSIVILEGSFITSVENVGTKISFRLKSHILNIKPGKLKSYKDPRSTGWRKFEFNISELKYDPRDLQISQ